MSTNGSRRAGDAATDSVSSNTAPESTRQTAHTQGTTAAARTRRASPKDRAQARAVAYFTHALARHDPNLNTKATLALVSRAFPDIRLDTALAGLVFRELFLRRDVSKARAESGLGRDFIFGAQRTGGRA
jgi:hypothetical protein